MPEAGVGVLAAFEHTEVEHEPPAKCMQIAVLLESEGLARSARTLGAELGTGSEVNGACEFEDAVAVVEFQVVTLPRLDVVRHGREVARAQAEALFGLPGGARGRAVQEL